MPSQNTLYLKLTGRTNCNSHEAHRQSHSQSKNLLMIHTGGNYIQVLARCYCEWKVSCYYKWVCVGEPMVAYIVVCIMILCSGAILEGNCFPFRLSDWGFFFFFFFHFPSQYRFSYLKIITWTTWQACPKRRAARIHHHFLAFCVHRVTFPTIWPTLSQLPSSTPIDCACVQPISKLVRKKSKSDTLLIARHVGEVFKILPKYMHLLLWNMLTYMYRTAFQHPAGADDP